MTPRTLPDAPSANVLAELRGRERPDEVVVIGAHLDSWDVGCGRAGRRRRAWPSSWRRCACCARSDLRPRRTLRAVLFTNEENGLRRREGLRQGPRRGAGAARRRHRGGLRRRRARWARASTAGPGAVEALAEILRPLAALGAAEAETGGGGADISAMKPAGVPQIGFRQDTTHYFDVHHTEADTLDKIDRADLARNAAAFAVLAYGVADAVKSFAPIPEDQRKD